MTNAAHRRGCAGYDLLIRFAILIDTKDERRSTMETDPSHTASAIECAWTVKL